jgi:hypothetical protein
MADAQVTGDGVLRMKLLAARLKEADPALKRELRKKFRDAAQPLVEDVQKSILTMPSRRKEGTLRAEVAKTVVLRTSFSSAGVRVNIDSLGQKMPPGKDTLPRHLDSVKGWNHPVWGHGPRGKWHWTRRRQHGKPGWFERPITDGAREFRDAALAAIAETGKHLGA